MEPLATLDELIARCDWTFDDDETRAAPGYLEEASDLIRAYGDSNWDPVNVPRVVKNIVISAVRRFMRNPDGYTQSRASDETLMWSDLGHDGGTIYFTPAELKLIRSLNSRWIVSSQVSAYGPRRRRNPFNQDCPEPGYVPVEGWPGEKPFPYYADPESPW